LLVSARAYRISTSCQATGETNFHCGGGRQSTLQKIDTTRNPNGSNPASGRALRRGFTETFVAATLAYICKSRESPRRDILRDINAAVGTAAITPGQQQGVQTGLRRGVPEADISVDGQRAQRDNHSQRAFRHVMGKGATERIVLISLSFSLEVSFH